MASKKLSALTAITSVGSDDLVYVADTADGGSSYSSKKVTKANFLSDYATTVAATAIGAANETHIDNLATLTGMAKDSTGLGTFTGSTISDASTIKAALQDLETGVEAAQAGSAVADRTKTQTDSTDATRYLTFVADDNGSATSETVFTDAGITYNPSSNTLTVGNLSVLGTSTQVDTVTMTATNAIVFEGATADANETTLTVIDPDSDRTIKLPNVSGCLPVLAADSSTAISATPAELNVLDGITASTAQLNFCNGVTSAIQTQLDNKQPLDADLTTLAGCQTGAAAKLALLTADEVAILDGATVSTAELNLLDGVTATTAELNILDGVTSTAAELNILDGVTATTTELNYVDGVTSSIQTQLNAKTADGDNVNNLVGDTSAGTCPVDGNGDDNYLFLVVNKANGAIVAIDKQFVEIE